MVGFATLVGIVYVARTVGQFILGGVLWAYWHLAKKGADDVY